jgi:hypothetical protein
VIAALLVLAWPREAVLGTYGSYKHVGKGFTIAKEINVGSYSNHEHEADTYREREQAIDTQVKPLLPMYEAWFARALGDQHPFGGWLDALDRQRSVPMPWDYKARLPGPIAPPKPERKEPAGLLALAPVASDDGRPTQVYLHMKPASPQLSQGRALVGFALAQAFLGDAPAFRVAPPPQAGWTLAQRLAHAVEGDSFAGQPALVAAAVVGARGEPAELTRLADDAAQQPAVRLLARLIALGLRHEPWPEADWARVAEAAKATDRRTLWTWMLVFVPTSEAVAREAELRKREPLSESDEHYFYNQYVQGLQK